MRKKVFLLSLIFMLFISIKVNAADSKDLIINTNKTNIVVNQESNGDYYLPLRDVVVALGGNSLFNPNTSSVIFNLNGNSFVYNIQTGKLDYNIDGLTHTYTSQFDLKIVNNRTLVSLSFLQKFLNISYEKTNENLLISSKGDLPNNFTIKPLLISHGGGEINGLPITNSLEAIKKSIKNGSRLIELDFLRTVDNKFVLGHDWGHASKHFNIVNSIKAYEEYKTETTGMLTPISLSGLIDILEENKDLSIVTDIKEGNKDFLLHIHNNYRPYMSQLKPQVYSIDEYHYAKTLGFKDIIYTLYQVYMTDDEIVSFARNNDVYAITMGESRVKSGVAKRLSNIGVMVYVHTVNDINQMKEFKKLGVGGFYTDRIY